MKPRFACLALAVGLTACGTTPDERPVTIEVVALSILAPTCGQVQCHSTSTHLEGYAFDTLAASKVALGRLVNKSNLKRSKLLTVIGPDAEELMPPDAPLAEEDIALIQAWVDAGAPGSKS
ncbi:MAG: hypothetical protein IPQ07_22510 [Myxococcales bacterium]|nr:hypothetical protein [Myxococcales bacterium]